MATAYDRRLQQQNDGESWLDCNARGLPHQWEFGGAIGWLKCHRCPVTTNGNGDGTAAPFLRAS